MKFRFSSMDALVAGVLTISLAFTGVSVSLLYSSYNFVPQGVEPAEYMTVLRDRDDPEFPYSALSLNEFGLLQRNFPEVVWFYEKPNSTSRVANGSNTAHRYVDLSEVSSKYFAALGVNAIDGMPINPALNSRVAVLSESVANALFEEDDTPYRWVVAGEDNAPVPVVATVSDDFEGLTYWPVKAWIVNAVDSELLDDSDIGSYYIQNTYIFGRSDESTSVEDISAQLANHVLVGEIAVGPGRTHYFGETNDERARALSGLVLLPFNENAAQRGSSELTSVVLALVILMFFLLAVFFDAEQRKHLHTLRVSYTLGAAPHQLALHMMVSHWMPFLVALVLAIVAYYQMSSLMLSYEPFKSHPGYLSAGAQLIAIVSVCALLTICALSSFAYGSYSLSRMLTSQSLTGSRTLKRTSIRFILLLLVVACMLFVASNVSYFSKYANFDFGVENVDIPTIGAQTPLSVTPESFKDELLQVEGVTNAARSTAMPLAPMFYLPDPVAVRGLSGVNQEQFYGIEVDAEFFDVYGVRTLMGDLDDAFRDNDIVLSQSMARALDDDVSNLIGTSISLESYSRPYNVIAIVDDVKFGNYFEPTTTVFYTKYRRKSGIDWAVEHVGDVQDVISALDENPLFGGVRFMSAWTPREILNYQFQNERSEETLIAWTATIILLLTGAAFCWSVLHSLGERRRFIVVTYATGASVRDITVSLTTPIWRDLLLCVLLTCLMVVFAEPLWIQRNIEIELWVVIPIFFILSVTLGLLVHSFVMRACGSQTVSYLMETETQN